MRSSHRYKQKREFIPRSFANQTAAFLKYLQVLTQTVQIDLMAERLPPVYMDNYTIYSKYSKIFPSRFFAAVASKEAEHKSKVTEASGKTSLQ